MRFSRIRPCAIATAGHACTAVYAAVVIRDFLALTALAACGSGSAPDLHGLSDQVAAVGQELVIELDGTDPDGDALAYSVHADISLDDNATMTKTPAGAGLFRWTPIVDRTSACTRSTSPSATATTTRRFRSRSTCARRPAANPCFASRSARAASSISRTTPCVTVDIVVEDSDSTDVTIAEEAPHDRRRDVHADRRHDRDAGSGARRPRKSRRRDRWTLSLSADDGENPKQLKNYVIVLGGSTAAPTLVINEVDYDNVSTDNAEYIELVNTSTQPVTLAGLKLVLVNGAHEHRVLDDRTLAAPARSRRASSSSSRTPASSANAQANKLDPLWTQDEIQNGAPDGIALIDDVTHTRDRRAVVRRCDHGGHAARLPRTGVARRGNRARCDDRGLEHGQRRAVSPAERPGHKRRERGLALLHGSHGWLREQAVAAGLTQRAVSKDAKRVRGTHFS